MRVQAVVSPVAAAFQTGDGARAAALQAGRLGSAGLSVYALGLFGGDACYYFN